MKKAILFILITTVSLSLSARQISSAQDQDSTAATIERLEKDIPELMKKADLPGLSTALIRDGKIVWTKGFGVRNAETKDPVTGETIFEAASLTKPVFAYAVLKLVNEGKIDLDVPLNKYLGNNYDAGDDKRIDLITARMVLSHSSGFPNWRRPRDAKILPIDFAPGERFGYSGEGFVYLAKVVEKITGKGLEDFVREKVFVPLKMENSSLVWQERFGNSKVFDHDSLGKVSGRSEDKEPNAAASLHTTAADYARFVVAVLNGDGLKKRTHERMLTPQIEVDPEESPELAWGLGLGLRGKGGAKTFWHWGDNGNNKAFVAASTKTQNGILFFTNGANGLSFLKEILDIGFGGENPSRGYLNYERYDSPARILLKDIVAEDALAALAGYLERRKQGSAYAVSEQQMNRLGYNLMFMQRLDDAIKVFEQNTKDFPASANVWDSLAEAWMKKGEKALAIKYYEKSLELDPANKNAEQMIRELKEIRANAKSGGKRIND
jgi:CubicO group peptidase (beta-lactamase class C family)